MTIRKMIRNASFMALLLAFMGGTALTGCSSSEEEAPDDCACSPDALNYPDCCQTTL